MAGAASVMEETQTAENKTPPGEVIRVETAAGDLRLHPFQSRIYRNTRFLRVWLPPAYDDPASQGRRYPVFYLNDGQNLFETSTAFGGVEWQVDETAERLVRENVVPPLIIVGIDNAGKDRLREYMPNRSLNPVMLRVQGPLYPNFLLNEVAPFVARNYRVAAGPENTGLGGSSLGGLIALYTAMARPDVFGRLLVESPSLWASNRQLLRESRNVKRWPERVFLATGTAEAGRADKDQRMVKDVQTLAGNLRRAGLNEKRLCLVIQEGASHSEAAWAQRFPEALAFLFGK
jgi:predicted alpha/beta superfamily hydrolase